MQLSSHQTSPDKRSSEDNAKHKDIDSRWIELKFSSNYTPRSYFASCIQAGNIYIHGGFNVEAGIMKDLLVCCLHQSPASWKTITAKNQKTCNPGPLRNHTLNSYYSQLILIGGQKNVVQNNNQIYRYDLLLNSWTICKFFKGKSFNYALDSHRTIVHNNFIYIIGGYDSISTQYLNAIIKIDLSKISEDILTYELIKIQKGPYQRANSSCCLVDNKIYLFGGGNMENVFDDLWIFDIESANWELVQFPENITWPEVFIDQSRKEKEQPQFGINNLITFFLFGGIKKITKEQNDINVYMLSKKRWIIIHSNTNELYDPSPTVKEQVQSPSICQSKRKNKILKLIKILDSFNLSMKPVSHFQSFSRYKQTNVEQLKKQPCKTQGIQTGAFDNKQRMSVVQQKKYQQILAKKRKFQKISKVNMILISLREIIRLLLRLQHLVLTRWVSKTVIKRAKQTCRK